VQFGRDELDRPLAGLGRRDDGGGVAGTLALPGEGAAGQHDGDGNANEQ
jgi:hypothetical protein